MGQTVSCVDFNRKEAVLRTRAPFAERASKYCNAASPKKPEAPGLKQFRFAKGQFVNPLVQNPQVSALSLKQP